MVSICNRWLNQFIIGKLTCILQYFIYRCFKNLFVYLISNNCMNCFGSFFFSSGQCCAACGMSVSQPGIKPEPLAVKAQSPNHSPTRELPGWILCGLNCVLPKIHMLKTWPPRWWLGGGTFERWNSHEGRAPMNGIGAEGSRESSFAVSWHFMSPPHSWGKVSQHAHHLSVL